MIQAECQRCSGFEEIHSSGCLVRTVIFQLDKASTIRPMATRKQAMDAAILAVQSFLNRDKKATMEKSCDIIPFDSFREPKGKRMSTVQVPVSNELILKNEVADSMPSKFKSVTIGKLADALSKAQAEIKNAAKDKDNPFFKSTYADLASVWDACREPLSKNGLSVTQPLSFEGGEIILTTLLLHSSGEWISSQVPVMPVKRDPQSIGSAITYMRRFSLSSVVGVAPSEKPTEDDVDDSDDDGNAASGRKIIIPPQKNPTPTQLKQLFAMATEAGYSTERLKELLMQDYDIEASKDLTMDQYQEVVMVLKATIQAKKIQPKDESEMPWSKYLDKDQMVK